MIEMTSKYDIIRHNGLARRAIVRPLIIQNEISASIFFQRLKTYNKKNSICCQMFLSMIFTNTYDKKVNV